MRQIYIVAMVLISSIALAQTKDSVFTDGGKQDVYYSLANGNRYAAANNQWDLAFTTGRFSASILINEAAGVELYLASSNAGDWDKIDTTGFIWKNLYNSEESWDVSAFQKAGAGHPDYGWGNYNPGNNNIIGTRIFIVKTVEGAYKQMFVESMKTDGKWLIKIGDIGGANTNSYTIDKLAAENVGRNFIPFNIKEGKETGTEPLANTWDLLFTKFMSAIQQGPSVVYYPVNGVKINANAAVAERNGKEVTDNDTNGLNWTTKVTEIGADWKTFNNQTFQYEYANDRVYFVKTAENAIHKIWFTKYEGGAKATSHFMVEQIQKGLSSKRLALLNAKLYPNPAQDFVYLKNTETEEATFMIYGLDGKILYNQVISGNLEINIDVTTWSKGIYFVEGKSATKTFTTKIVKN